MTVLGLRRTLGQLKGIGRLSPTPPGKGGVTALTREANGTVTVTSLARTWTPNLTREANGTVTVS